MMTSSWTSSRARTLRLTAKSFRLTVEDPIQQFGEGEIGLLCIRFSGDVTLDKLSREPLLLDKQLDPLVDRVTHDQVIDKALLRLRDAVNTVLALKIFIKAVPAIEKD